MSSMCIRGHLQLLPRFLGFVICLPLVDTVHAHRYLFINEGVCHMHARDAHCIFYWPVLENDLHEDSPSVTYERDCSTVRSV